MKMSEDGDRHATDATELHIALRATFRTFPQDRVEVVFTRLLERFDDE
jgi:hypothetical protein